MAQRTITKEGTGAASRIPVDPAIAGGRINPDPAIALTNGLKMIPCDPQEFEAAVAAGSIKVDY